VYASEDRPLTTAPLKVPAIVPLVPNVDPTTIEVTAVTPPMASFMVLSKVSCFKVCA
jgi:hypothetical protein